MRLLIIVGFLLLQFSDLTANINFIKTEKIPDFGKNEKYFAFAFNHQNYIDHWTPEWKYEIEKSSLIDSLEMTYKAFDQSSNKTAETHLLLGVISHYLYNLDVRKYYDLAVLNYQTAFSLDSIDFRGHWFLGFHYALSGNAEKSIPEIFTAQQLLTDEVPIAFWEDYIQATHLAGMPSHSLMGMSVIKNGTGEASYMEQQIGDAIRKRFKPTFRDSTYDYHSIWNYDRQNLLIFTSRMLGMSFAIDSTWGLSFYDFKNGQAVIMIKPPGITSSKGRLITYSILILVRSPENNKSLESFVDPLIKNYPIKLPFKFTDQLPVDLAYDIRDPKMYNDIDGGHFNMVAFSRNEPEFPGMDLEVPKDVQSSDNSGQPSYFSFKPFYTRLKGPVQYAFLLDTCEDIYEESHKVFKDFLIQQVILE